MSKRLVTSLFMIVLLFITLSSVPASLAGRICGVIKPVKPGFTIGVGAFSRDRLHIDNVAEVDPETGRYVIVVYKPGTYDLTFAFYMFAMIAVETGVSHAELRSDDRAAIEQVLLDMNEAVGEKDVDRLMKHYSQKYYTPAGSSHANKSAQLEEEIQQFKHKTFSRHIYLMEGDEERVAVIYRGEFEPVKPPEKTWAGEPSKRAFDGIVWFEKEGGTWKIVKERKISQGRIQGQGYYYTRYPGPEFPPLRYITDPNLVGIEVTEGQESTGHNYTIPPEVVDIGLKIQKMRDRGRRAVCLSNLKQIGLGLHMYAMDHNEAFPEDISALYPKYSGPRVFKCPSDESISEIKEIKPGTRISYVYVRALTTKDSSGTIVAYDASPYHHEC